MKVPFLDVGAAYRELADELDQAYRTVMRSGRYLFGAQLEQFEHEFAAHEGATHAAAVGSGFDALVLALRAFDLRPGDEVLVPTNTIGATWQAVAAVGGRPVGVEPDESTHTIDPDLLELARTDRTRAVIPVHLYGRPASMEPIVDWAHSRGVAVIADAAQAHGSRLGGQPVGGLGDAAAWSFYPSKNLGGFGDGGMVTSNDATVIARVRRLRNYGADERDLALEIGTNSRLDELQAAFLRVRLAHLDAWNERRRTNALKYLSALADLPVDLPPGDDLETQSAWHLFVVRVSDRGAVRDALAAAQVETLVHYPTPPFAQPAFAGLEVAPTAFPIARRLADEVLSLPVGPHLDPAGLDAVVERLHSVYMDLRLTDAPVGHEGA
jgi:dTDP-3-amino-3,4,6-trideoxy-alpha-D-glucose transaminase